MSGFNKDLETAYSPSKFGKRFPTSEEHENFHINFCKNESAKVLIESKKNISYGNLNRQKLDIFGTDLPNEAPILIFIHGGYWQMEVLTKDFYHFLATPLHQKGVKTIFIGYELCPGITFSELIFQIEAATRKCIDYAKTCNSKGLYVCGHSAGGHLAAHLFTSFISQLEKDEIQFMKMCIPIGGLFYLQPLLQTSYNDALKLDETSAKMFSPILQIKKNYFLQNVKFLVVVEQNASAQFIQQSTDFYKELKNNNCNAEFLLVKNFDHFDIIENLIDNNFTVSQHLIKAITS